MFSSGPYKNSWQLIKNTMERPSFESIEKRIPVLDKESAQPFPPEEMDRQWRLLTETIRRDILGAPETRQSVAGYAAIPVSETLPNDFLSHLSPSGQTDNLRKRYQDQIGRYLELAPVPEDQLDPDIRHAQALRRPETYLENLKSLYGADTPEYYTSLKQQIRSGSFLRGVTAQERLMAAQRYRFARDVKLLALQAEVLGQGSAIQIENQDEIKLPSGITITINAEDKLQRRELLSPQNWEKRRQLKDRVYEIQVGGSKYILKEKKTARHTDTKKHGHRPGLPSAEEFQTARHFQKNGVAERGNIKVDWEKPLAAVTFPDGFQFTVFERADGLLEEGSVTESLAREIQEKRVYFEQEFQAIQAMAEKFKDDPRVLGYGHGNSESKLRAILRWMGGRSKPAAALTFEEFAMIKAMRMKSQAQNLMREAIIENGYTNSDLDGYAYKINARDGAPQLEIFGFDFEYFSKIDPGDKEERLKEYRESQPKQDQDEIMIMGGYCTRMQKAGCFALLESEGLLSEDGE